MLILAVTIGLYSYAIFFLGLAGLLNFIPISLLLLLIIVVFFFKINRKANFSHDFSLKEKLSLFAISLLLIVNLIGVLSPELAFDALWYHLTFPKIFIEKGQIFFIPGNLFYYSLMPKLTEMLYLPALMYAGESLAKFIHFFFGILSSIVVFKLVRIYFNREWALVGVVVFLSNLVVSWLMTIAYSDLSRSFYEILALLYFLKYDKTEKARYLLISAVLIGFAVSVKLVSLGTILVFVALLFIKYKDLYKFIRNSILFVGVSLAIPIPWFVYSFIHIGNPIYPLFSKLGVQYFTTDLFNPIYFVETFIKTFLFSPDPITPIFLMSLPLFLFKQKSFFVSNKMIIAYAVIGYLVWYVFFQPGGSRFLTSYFGSYVVLLLLLISKEEKRIRNIFVFSIFALAFVTILYRGLANARSLPYIFGYQTKEEFLMNRLNFNFGDFYDEGGGIKKIVGDELVILHNLHNIYYVDFNYTFSDWKDAENAKYALVQHGELGRGKGKLVYQNEKTHVKLYQL